MALGLLLAMREAAVAEPYLVSDGSLLTDDTSCRFDIDFNNSGSVLQALNVLLSTSERYKVRESAKRGPISLARVSTNGYDARFRMQYLGYHTNLWYVSADWIVEIKISLTDKMYLNVLDKNNIDSRQDNITLDRCDGKPQDQIAEEPSDSSDAHFQASIAEGQAQDVARLRNFEWHMGNVYNTITAKLLLLGVKNPLVKASANRLMEKDKEARKAYIMNRDESALETHNKREIETRAYYCKDEPSDPICR
ncbi:hypothetical protein [Mesorhizobium sp. M0816]|uniref:hypothetical protein n=1 Tax=Mesorhizobium sp. M0816 TaxID=2957006 RepID=UPI003339544A